MSSYAKFSKEILTKKRKFEAYEIVTLTKDCSALIQNKLPPKLKDLGSFFIPCEVGAMKINKVLCDLKASVSLMPHSVFKKMDVAELKPTQMILQLVDRSIKDAIGRIEDVQVKDGKFYIRVDFVVLEMDEDAHIPIILG
ncbi:uncharacterized protein LOC105637098 [Jatropha curcas]|uniref:uncharacterized protein LOC105637098 n=1 Tax=Jatropha curcas TaxID=180498 RepID=UPI0005FAB3D3|nr:uncharacterized protein LOC105637098 [Jatropha curcas]